MNKYHNYFKLIYGDGAEMSVTTEHGITISGIMYGNDECFAVNDFYQVLVSNNEVFYCFYLLDGLDENMDLSNIDYEHPYRVVNITDQYEGIL